MIKPTNTPAAKKGESSDVLLHAALAQVAAGRLSEAETVCRTILMAEPHHARAWDLLGGIATQRGNIHAAIGHYRRAVAAAPRRPEPYSNLASALLAASEVKEAISALKMAIRVNPDYGFAYVNLGDALMKANQPEEALAVLERAIALLPTDAKAYTNLGAALTRLKRLDEAIEILGAAIHLSPRLAEAHFNLGGAYSAKGCFDQAIACFGKALELQPGFQNAAFFRSHVLLALGRFAEGWRDYLERLSARKVSTIFHREPLGADLTGVRILLGRDQGLGDEIFFLRFAVALKRRGAHVTYHSGGKVLPLFQRLPFLDVVIDEDVALDVSEWDLAISIGDLPFLLGMTTAAEIPPSLTIPALPELLQTQKAALAALGPPPYIGVTWRAGLDQTESLFKVVPLEKIGAVLRNAGGTVVALQRLPQKGEISRLAKAVKRPVHDFTALNDRLEDMIALLSQLDDYVTVSNTNVHLRAAVGRGSRVLVPWPAEFRWMATGSVSPWFPDCVVYRQNADWSWNEALEVLAADLAATRQAGGSRPSDSSQQEAVL